MKRNKLGEVLFLIFITLNLIGILYNGYIFTESGASSKVLMRTLYSVVSIGSFFIFSHIKLRYYFRYSGWIYLGTLLLLLSVFIPGLGFSILGATRWITIKIAGRTVSLQPAEFGKIALCIFCSTIFGRYHEIKVKEKYDLIMRFLTQKVHGTRIFLVTAGTIGYITIVLFQHDLGMMAFYALIMLIFLTMAPVPKIRIIMMLLLGISLLSGLIMSSPNRRSRILAFLDVEKHKMGAGYQLMHSLIGIGSGGIYGKGFGNSEEVRIISEAENDFIMAIIGEELGFVGCTSIVCLFMILGGIGTYISLKQTFIPYKYLAYGLTSVICIQSTMNFCVILGLMPTKGVPLPIISYGGSSLIVNSILFGMLNKLSKEIK